MTEEELLQDETNPDSELNEVENPEGGTLEVAVTPEDPLIVPLMVSVWDEVRVRVDSESEKLPVALKVGKTVDDSSDEGYSVESPELKAVADWLVDDEFLAETTTVEVMVERIVVVVVNSELDGAPEGRGDDTMAEPVPVPEPGCDVSEPLRVTVISVSED